MAIAAHASIALRGRLLGPRREVASAAEPRHGARVDAPHDGAEIVGLRGWQRMELHARSPNAREDAIEKSHVVVNVQIETSAEALNERNGAALAAVDSVALGALAIVSEHFLDEDARERRQDIGRERREPT